MKPPDQDLQCFQKRINQENKLAESQVGGVLTFQEKYCQHDNGLMVYQSSLVIVLFSGKLTLIMIMLIFI